MSDTRNPASPPAAEPASLFMLAFDHRKSIRPLFGIEGAPDEEGRERIGAAKTLILDALLVAREQFSDDSVAGLLVDEETGGRVLERAREEGVVTAVAVERSGQREFQFEYGDDFAAHVEHCEPTLVKALVRYNVEGDEELNRRQLERLRQLSAWLSSAGRKLLFELLVPPEPEQLARVAGDAARFDRELRPELVRRAVATVQENGIEVATWKIEGIERREDCESIATVCRRGNAAANCLILGRGADESKVEHWLAIAAPVPGFEGFAVGRTIWWDAIASHLSGAVDREATVTAIARRYLHFVEHYRDSGGT